MDACTLPADMIGRLTTDLHGLLSHVAGLPAADREHFDELVEMARQRPDYDPWNDDLLIQEFSFPSLALRAAA
jgi:hypothetical protein